MNRERAKELLPIMQAFADGKEIQGKHKQTGKWITMNEPIYWDWDIDNEYRIKPEPREFWVIEHEDKSLAIYTDTFLSGAFKVREVLDND